MKAYKLIMTFIKGGAGSGHRGHSGRKGKRGGSEPGGSRTVPVTGSGVTISGKKIGRDIRGASLKVGDKVTYRGSSYKVKSRISDAVQIEGARSRTVWTTLDKLGLEEDDGPSSGMANQISKLSKLSDAKLREALESDISTQKFIGKGNANWQDLQHEIDAINKLLKKR